MERLRQELERVEKYHVPPTLNLEVLLYILLDLLNPATGVRNHLLDNQSPVVSAQVMDKHRNVIDDFTLSVAKVVRCIDVVAGHMLVVVNISLDGMLAIERTVGPTTNAADHCF